MTRTGRAALGVITNHASALVMAVAGFVLVPIMLRYIGREDYGLWATVGQVLGYLALLDLGVGSAIVRRAAQLRESNDAERVNRMISTGVALYCAFAAVFMICGLAVSILLPKWQAIPPERSSIAVTAFVLMVTYTAVSFPLRIGINALVGYQRMALANLLNLAASLLTIVIAVFLLRVGAGLLALPIGTAVAGLCSGIGGMIALRAAIPTLSIRWKHVSSIEAREMFNWSWQIFLNNIAVVVIYQTDNLVVANSLGLGAVTVYTLTSRLPLYAMPLIFALSDSCLPGAVELCQQENRERLKSVFLRILQVTSAAAFGTAAIAWVLNDGFMRLWVRYRNYGGSALTLLFAVILVTRVLNQTASVVIISTGKLRGVVYMSIAEALLNLGLSMWLVRIYGILGVAVGTVVAGFLTSNWYVIRVVCTELRLNLLKYLLRGPGPALLTAVATAALAVALLQVYPVTSWIRLFSAAPVIGLVYVAIYAIVGLRATELRQIFTQINTTRRNIKTRLQEAF
jgi:O-antigen/teichoic acid export membrane protein